MNYVSNDNPEIIVSATQVPEDTTIQTDEYGPVLITAGNYVVEYTSDNALNGKQFGITKSDLDLYYTPQD